MDLVIALALVLGANLAWQETADARLVELLRAFEGRGEEADLDDLAEEIDALGSAVLEPAARRLAEDLRDGMASLAAPALVDVLSARAADVAPLRAAFADPATPPSGRVQIARALADLDDVHSWRPALRALLADPDAALDARLGAAGALLEAGDGPALPSLRALVEAAPARPRPERERVYEFLARANTPESRRLLDDALDVEELLPDEPRERVVAERPSRAGLRAPSRDPKKSVVAAADWTTMVEVAAVAAALALLLACWLLQRKG
jgi:hypothetical protein